MRFKEDDYTQTLLSLKLLYHLSLYSSYLYLCLLLAWTPRGQGPFFNLL